MAAIDTLTDMRRAGVRPGAPVHVAFSDPAVVGLTIFMRDAARRPIDWRVLVDLDVVVWADAETPFGDVCASLTAIAKARPRELQLCFLHADEWHLIDCGTGRHWPAVADVPVYHEFHWLPLNLGGTTMGYRIKFALDKTLRPGSFL